MIALSIDSVGKALAATELNISELKIAVTFSKTNGYQVVSKGGQKSDLSLKTLLLALRGSSVKKILLSVSDSSNFSAIELQNTLNLLANNYSLEMGIVPDSVVKLEVLRLMSVSFNTELAAVRLNDTRKVLVVIETPYNYPLH